VALFGILVAFFGLLVAFFGLLVAFFGVIDACGENSLLLDSPLFSNPTDSRANQRGGSWMSKG
jgi:hypothetical protein